MTSYARFPFSPERGSSIPGNSGTDNDRDSRAPGNAFPNCNVSIRKNKTDMSVLQFCLKKAKDTTMTAIQILHELCDELVMFYVPLNIICHFGVESFHVPDNTNVSH